MSRSTHARNQRYAPCIEPGCTRETRSATRVCIDHRTVPAITVNEQGQLQIERFTLTVAQALTFADRIVDAVEETGK